MAATRREVLARTGALGAGIAFTGSVSELYAGTAAAHAPKDAGYGPLVPDPNGLLDLPKGFEYRVLSREGDQLLSGEGAVPSNHDGMAAFRARGGDVRLVRNHENRPTASHRVPAIEGLTYDPMGMGGCTVLEVDRNGELEGERVGIAGTAVNCAGGPSLWGTWLTCEETEDKAGTNGYTKDHGFIFEVDPVDPHESGAEPLAAMGRFQHEAVAFDPSNGVVYETEDAFQHPFGLFYRFLPKKPKGGLGSLRAGGELQAMRVPDVPDLSVVEEIGTTFDNVEWIEVPDPLAAETPIRHQDFGRAMSHAQKLEGCYWGGNSVYFVSSFAKSSEGSGGDHFGQVWRYTPRTNELKLVIRFGPDHGVDTPGESPDNIALSPSGGLFLCEDGGGEQHVYGVSRRGEVFAVARNRQNTGSAEDPEYGEFAGVTFSPNGRTMYVNCYAPGTTFAITGPWR